MGLQLLGELIEGRSLSRTLPKMLAPCAGSSVRTSPVRVSSDRTGRGVPRLAKRAGCVRRKVGKKLSRNLCQDEPRRPHQVTTFTNPRLRTAYRKAQASNRLSRSG